MTGAAKSSDTDGECNANNELGEDRTDQEFHQASQYTSS
jgi:hypothetical protein